MGLNVLSSMTPVQLMANRTICCMSFPCSPLEPTALLSIASRISHLKDSVCWVWIVLLMAGIWFDEFITQPWLLFHLLLMEKKKWAPVHYDIKPLKYIFLHIYFMFYWTGLYYTGVYDQNCCIHLKSHFQRLSEKSLRPISAYLRFVCISIQYMPVHI